MNRSAYIVETTAAVASALLTGTVLALVILLAAGC